jgi:pyruvate,water dikinase
LHNNINKISEENFSIIREQFKADANKDIIGLSDKELLNYGEHLQELFLNRDLTLIVSGGASAYYDYLQKFLKTVFVDEEKSDSIVNELITGGGDIISVNQTLTLVRLAGEAKKSDKVLEAMEKDIESCYIKLAGTQFRQKVDDFLQEFGHRCSHETDVEIPRYSENPTLILKIIKTYIDAGMTDPTEISVRQKKVREAAEEKVLERIKEGNFSYFKIKLFKFYLDKCRNFVALREKNRYYYCAMTSALARKIYLESGRRFTERGILEQQNDVFFLNLIEFRKLLHGEQEDVKNIVINRKIERENNSKLIVPDVIIGDVFHILPKETVKETETVFTGRGASSGLVQGRANIIRSPEEFKKFKAGDILVTPATDPNWSVLFPIAKAVVTEMGGLLSHASIVAREYGIPCVVNVQGFIAALEDGDLIEVDGTSGIVKIKSD